MVGVPEVDKPWLVNKIFFFFFFENYLTNFFLGTIRELFIS